MKATIEKVDIEQMNSYTLGGNSGDKKMEKRKKYLINAGLMLGFISSNLYFYFNSKDIIGIGQNTEKLSDLLFIGSLFVSSAITTFIAGRLEKK